MTPSDPPKSGASPELFGKYELIDRLGRGGMADVWRARVAGPQGFQRTLVLKRILPHLVEDPKARQLFEREARVVSRLSHANVVQVFEFGEVAGEYYLAMEYVEGRDLAAIIRAGGSVPEIAALTMRDVCRALAYAHGLADEQGVPLRILHRDVSPSNVMVGYDGSVRLLDFGIAKAFADARDKRTVKGTIRGKFGYIAPEVIDGLDPDPRADLFAVGVVLHEALTGKRLFRGASDLETLALVKRSVIPRPSELNPNVPPALEEICLRALERDRELRYASAHAMADALDEVVHELRFGPAQLAAELEQMFPRGQRTDWDGVEDTGPRTKREASAAAYDLGLGTARIAMGTPAVASDDDIEERPTTRMATDAAHEIAQSAIPTVPGRRPVMEQPPAKAPLRTPGRRRAQSKVSGVLYLVVGLLAGGAIAGVLLFATRPDDLGEVPKRAVAADLAPPRAADLASAPALAEPKLIFAEQPAGSDAGAPDLGHVHSHAHGHDKAAELNKELADPFDDEKKLEKPEKEK